RRGRARRAGPAHRSRTTRRAAQLRTRASSLNPDRSQRNEVRRHPMGREHSTIVLAAPSLDRRRRALLLAAGGATIAAAMPKPARADAYLAATSMQDPNALLDDLEQRSFAYFW